MSGHTPGPWSFAMKVSDELYTIAKRNQVDTRTMTYSPDKGFRVQQP